MTNLDWAKGYQSAIADVAVLAETRGIGSPQLDELLTDLRRDAQVIDHEHQNRRQREVLKAKQEALPL